MSCINSTNIFLISLVSGMTTDIRASDVEHRPFMTFAYAFSVTCLVLGTLISNLLSIDTFRQVQIRSTHVGMYLIVYSFCSIFGAFMLESRLFRMLDSFTYETSVLLCSVISGLASISTRICLWLNSFIALQRAYQSLSISAWLNKIGSVVTAPKQLLFIMASISLMHVHEFIYRVTIVDPQDNRHFICQIRYPPSILQMNTIFSLIHLFIPLILNVSANCIILASISQRRATLYQTSYWIQWKKHFRRHYHLFLAPTFSLVCTLPQIILALNLSCVNFSFTWLLRLNTAVNLLIYLPQAVTFFIFISLSEAYLEVFKSRSRFAKWFLCRRKVKNSVQPATLMYNGISVKTIP